MLLIRFKGQIKEAENLYALPEAYSMIKLKGDSIYLGHDKAVDHYYVLENELKLWGRMVETAQIVRFEVYETTLAYTTDEYYFSKYDRLIYFINLEDKTTRRILRILPRNC